MIATVLVVAVGVGWLLVTAYLARSESRALRLDLPKLETALASGNETTARQLVHTMQSDAADLHAHTTGPAWWVASKLPGLGDPVVSIRAQSVLLNNLAHTALPPALAAGEALNPRLLRTGPGSLDLTRLAAAQPVVARASTAVSQVTNRVAALPPPTWIDSVNRGRADIIREFTNLNRGLSTLATATRLLPGPLGGTGVKRYFLAFQSDAEARGLGGVPGSYAILTARNGHLAFTRFGSDEDLVGASSHLNFGRAFADRYDADYDPQDVIQNSNASPHFPYAAQIWMAMWEARFHQHLDGAIATDPAALGYLLGATGSVTLPDGTVINSDDSVRFFENATYLAFPSYDLAPREQFQNIAAKAVADKVLHEQGANLVATASALDKAAGEGRLLVYVSDPAVERTLAASALGGVLPRTDQPFLDVVINNNSGTKLDYYLSRTVTYSRPSCSARSVTVTVTLHNGAPDHDLPDSVLGRAPGIRPEPAIGEDGIVVSLYGTHGSSVSHATANGKTEFIDVSSERGHPVTSARLEIRSDETFTLVFHVHEPVATGPLVVATQPLVQPQHTVLNGAVHCTPASPGVG